LIHVFRAPHTRIATVGHLVAQFLEPGESVAEAPAGPRGLRARPALEELLKLRRCRRLSDAHRQKLVASNLAHRFKPASERERLGQDAIETVET
jgi:hypothetical protein